MRLFCALIATLLVAACQTVPPDRGIDVIYVPTPYETVDAMLALGEVKAGDVVYDLGSGDGRIPIEAARRFGVMRGFVQSDLRLAQDQRAGRFLAEHVHRRGCFPDRGLDRRIDWRAGADPGIAGRAIADDRAEAVLH